MFFLHLIFLAVFSVFSFSSEESYYLESTDVPFHVDRDQLYIDDQDDPVPFKLCKVNSTTYQKFRFFKNSDGTIGGIVALGSTVEPSVILRNTSICNLNESTFATIKGNVEIYDSYIAGGEIDSEHAIPEEGFVETRKVFINKTKLTGDFKIYQKVHLNNFIMTGDPILFGREGDGIELSDSEINYVVQNGEQAKGIYGSVKMYHVYGSGNFDIQSYTSDSPVELSYEKNVDPIFDIQIYEMGSKENPKFNGNIYLRNKVVLNQGSFKGSVLLDGNEGKGIDIYNSNLDYSEITGTINGIKGSVGLYNVNILKKNVEMVGHRLPSTAKKKNLRKIKNKPIFPKSFQKLADEYGITLSGDNELNQPLVLDGNFKIKNQVAIYGGTLKGSPTVDGNIGSGISCYKPTIDYSSVVENVNGIFGQVGISESTIKKNPKILGKVNIYGPTTKIDGNFEIISPELDESGVPLAYITDIGDSQFTQTDLNTPSLIKGPVSINKLKITGSPTIKAGQAYPRMSIYDSEINGNPSLKGFLDIGFAIIDTGNTIEYNRLASEPSYLVSDIKGDEVQKISLSGTNILNGFFGVYHSLNSITINAGPFNSYQNGQSVNIARDTTLGTGIELTGYVEIYPGAVIDSGVKIHGTEAIDNWGCYDCIGVTVNLDSEVHGSDTVLTGYLYLGNSKIYNSTITINQPSFDKRWSRIHNSTVSGSTLSGSIYVDTRTLSGLTLSGQIGCNDQGCYASFDDYEPVID